MGLQEIEVEVEAGPAPIRSFQHNGQWQVLEGVYEMLEMAVSGPANAVLCHYGPMRGILIYGGPFGLNLGGSGVPVIWTQEVKDLPEDVRETLGVARFATEP